MATDPQRLFMTEEEYLAFDRASETKHEYWDGEVVAMAGGTKNHNRHSLNMVTALSQQIGPDDPCRVYGMDMRVQVSKKKYVYPDIVVSCDDSDHDGESDILHSPHLIVEVLSPSTERDDRGKKLLWYQAKPTLLEYVLVNYRIRWVELYRRPDKSGGAWLYLTYGPGQVIELESLDARIPVDTLYARLRIPTPAIREEEE